MAGGSRIEHNKLIGSLGHRFGEGLKNGDLFDARGTQLLFEQRHIVS